MDIFTQPPPNENRTKKKTKKKNKKKKKNKNKKKQKLLTLGEKNYKTNTLLQHKTIVCYPLFVPL